MFISALIALALGAPSHFIVFRDQADQFTLSIQERYWEGASKCYAEYVSEGGTQGSEPSFAWDLAVQMSALAAACKLEPKKFQPLYDKAVVSLKTYGATSNGVYGYGVLPNSNPPDRFYDDDEWIALAQLDAYDALHRKKDLLEAAETFQFVLSGESSDLGGGIFWREKERTSKNTCSNAPAIACAARLYLATKDSRYLEIAERLHIWVEQLKDRDGLMFDNVNLKGEVDKTKWTYNTALMIRADLLLYQATHKKAYLDEAVLMGTASVGHWVDPDTGAIHDEASFAHHLSEAFFDLSRFDKSLKWREIGAKAVEQAYSLRDERGLLGIRWDRHEVRDHRMILLAQASMARGLWIAAANH
jgi:hypothetical protein